MPIFGRQLTGNERAAQQREAARRRLETASYAPKGTATTARGQDNRGRTSIPVRHSATARGPAANNAAAPTKVTTARTAPSAPAGPLKSAATMLAAYIKASIAAAATILFLQTIASAAMGTGNPLWLLIPVDKVGAIFMGPFFALSLVVPIIMVARVVRLTGLSGQTADIATGMTVMALPFLLNFAAQPLSEKGLTMLGIALTSGIAGAVGGYTFWNARTPRPAAA